MSPFALLDGHFAPVPEPRRTEWLARWTYAHRGLHGPRAPENSLSAFAAAAEKELGIELDVLLSSDGKCMVFHDWDLERMTGESGPVAARSAGQLGQVRLAGSEQGIPTLRQVLDLVAGRSALLIEVKSRREMRVAPACLAVRRELEGYRGPHAVISFDPRVIRWFARHSPLTLRGLSYTEDGDRSLPARLRRRVSMWLARPDFLTYDLRDLPSGFPAEQRRRGLPLVTWTVEDVIQRRRAEPLADAQIAEGEGLP